MAAEQKSVIEEFKEFILRGNVVDLAVAVVIGAAFGAVVDALVKDISYSPHRRNRRQAQLLESHLYDPQEQVPLRRPRQRHRRFLDDFRSGLLLRGQTGQLSPRAA